MNSTKKIKIIFLPIGNHDIAGNKRLKNLSKYLIKNHNLNIRVVNVYGRTFIKSRSNLIYEFLNKSLSYISGVVKILHILKREREKKATNVLYFYEGEHIFLHRVLFAKLLGYKIIIDLVENPNALAHTKSFLRKIRIVYFLMMYKLIPCYASGIVVVSKLLKNKIKKDFGNKIPVFLLPVSFDIDDYNVTPKEYSYSTIFYGGSYGANYDFTSFLQAFNNVINLHHDLKLFLSGNIPEEIVGLIKKTTHPENVFYLGFLDEKDYFSTICSMDILCMPRNNSLHANAGFPFKLAEYLATGKPVLTSDVSDIRDYITPDDAYIYPPGDNEQIEKMIKQILTDPQQARLKGESGRKKAGEYFSAVKQADDLLGFIHSILK